MGAGIDRHRRKRREDREFLALLPSATDDTLRLVQSHHTRKSPPWKRVAIAREMARRAGQPMPSPTTVLGCDRSGLYLLLRSSLR